MSADGQSAGPLPGVLRIAQRHLIPSFITALWFSLRYGCSINPKAQVQHTSNIKIGKGTVIKSLAFVQTSGGPIEIGKQCAISSFSHIATRTATLKIGDYVRMGPGVTITATTSRYQRADELIMDQGYDNKGITIGNDVFIGSGATILDGVTIGDGAVIGVGSVVVRNVEPYTIVFGVPAKRILKRSGEPKFRQG